MKLPISPICKLLLVNPATTEAGKGPFQQLEGYKHGSVQQWLKKGSKQPIGENGQSLKWMKRENYAAAVHGYTFLLLTPFSFDKLLKKMIDEL